MRTRLWAIGLVFASTLLAATGQILLKSGVNSLSLDAYSLVTNIPLIGGYFLYGVSAIVLVIALKYGELSVLYPVYAMNFIWVSLASPYFFPSDSMNPMKWAGVLLVVAGVTAIGVGSRGGKDD